MNSLQQASLDNGPAREHWRLANARLTAERDRAVRVAELLARILRRVTVIYEYDADMIMDGLINYDRLVAFCAEPSNWAVAGQECARSTPHRVADLDGGNHPPKYRVNHGDLDQPLFES